MTYDRLYIQFLYYFNVERDYFECHEVLEELWLEEGRFPLYQGLLQVAVALYHHRNGNVGGSIKLFTAAIEKLEMYSEQEYGIDLYGLLNDAKQYLAKLHQEEREPFDFYDLSIVIRDSELAEEVEKLKRNPPDKHEE
jgi:predicted metal-dependent hydrolase